MHEAQPRRDATHLKRGGIVPPKTKTVALPVSPPATAAGGNSCLSMRRLLSPPGSRRQPVPLPSLRSARARSTACAPWPQWRSAVCARPTCRRALGTTLPARCQAGSEARAMRADHSRPCARVSGPANAPIAIHAAALVGHWCDCLLYTSDAADEEDSVDLGGRRI